MKLHLLDDKENIMREIEIADSNFLLISNDLDGLIPDVENMGYMRIDDAHIIDQRQFIPVVRQLLVKYSGILAGLRTTDFICVIDTAWQPTEKASKNSRWKIDIQKSNYWLREMTGAAYMIKLRLHWTEQWTEAQLAAAIMSQLLRVNLADGSIMKYTEDMASRMIATFGDGYLEPHTAIPNILKEDIKIKAFPTASGQISFDELEEDETDE